MDIAATMDRDRAYVLNEAVDEFIELYQWKVAPIQEGLAQAEKKQFATKEEVTKAPKRWKK
jgi:RHH-type transcriptional regulator, rel operon repressor / antitoxin RelB